MGTTTHASTLRSDSYTGHIEAAGAIALIRVSHTTHVRTLDPTPTHQKLEENVVCTFPETDQDRGCV